MLDYEGVEAVASFSGNTFTVEKIGVRQPERRRAVNRDDLDVRRRGALVLAARARAVTARPGPETRERRDPFAAGLAARGGVVYPVAPREPTEGP